MALNLTGIYEAQGWPQTLELQSRLAGLVGTLRAVANRDSATPAELNSCAWLLLTIEPESFRDTPAALAAATRCCDLERQRGGAELWQYLDTLALARFRSDLPEQAAADQAEAISLVPPAGEAYREEMQERLAQYQAAAQAKRP
jgi:hypothetical protein